MGRSVDSALREGEPFERTVDFALSSYQQARCIARQGKTRWRTVWVIDGPSPDSKLGPGVPTAMGPRAATHCYRLRAGAKIESLGTLLPLTGRHLAAIGHSSVVSWQPMHSSVKGGVKGWSVKGGAGSPLHGRGARRRRCTWRRRSTCT